MKIIRIVGNMHQSVLIPWHERAVNSPIHRFLNLSPYANTTVAPADGWNSVHFMDENQTTLLSLSPDRANKTCGISLWSLPGNQPVAAMFFRFLAHKAIDELDLHQYDYTFAIASFNTQWLVMVLDFLKSGGAEDARWGIEPRGTYDKQTGKWMPLHQFRLPVNMVAHILEGRRQRRAHEIERKAMIKSQLFQT